jgi:hypothetical protein
MTSTLLVLLLLSQAEGSDNPPDGATKPPLSAFPAGRWRYPARMELWTGLLLALALLSNACAPLTPPPGRGTHLRYTPHEAAAPIWAEGPGEPSAPEPEGPQRLHRRLGARETVTAVGPGGAEETAWGSALAAHLAFRGALLDMAGSTRDLSGELSRLRKSHWGIAGKAAGLFVPSIEYGQSQLRWLDAELAAATRLAHTAAEVEDPDMQLALLRLAGPRLEAAMLGSLLLAAWGDCLGHLPSVPPHSLMGYPPPPGASPSTNALHFARLGIIQTLSVSRVALALNAQRCLLGSWADLGNVMLNEPGAAGARLAPRMVLWGFRLCRG